MLLKSREFQETHLLKREQAWETTALQIAQHQDKLLQES